MRSSAENHSEGDPQIDQVVDGMLSEILTHVQEGSEQRFFQQLYIIVNNIDKYEGQRNSQYEEAVAQAEEWFIFRNELFGLCQTLGDTCGIVMEPGVSKFSEFINRMFELPPRNRKTLLSRIKSRIKI